jgi:hypothetical protein
MVHVQAKIRLRKSTISILDKYCEYSEMKRSQVINKALLDFFKQEQDFTSEYEIENNNQHNIISVSELEDVIFNRYKIMIYIHAEQGEKIGINLDYWPKVMGRYTIKEFKEKIIRQCLARNVDVDIIDKDSHECNSRQTIKVLKSTYSRTINKLEDYHDIWEQYV